MKAAKRLVKKYMVLYTLITGATVSVILSRDTGVEIWRMVLIKGRVLVGVGSRGNRDRALGRGIACAKAGRRKRADLI